MQCECSLSHAATEMRCSHEPNQIIGQQTEAKKTRLQTAFYYYDPLEGTKCRLVNATATIAASAAAGATSSLLMIAYLPRLITSGSSIFARAIVQLDRAFPYSPFYISSALGATLGTAGAFWLINSAYQDGLKPRTVAAVRYFMNELIHQVESNLKSIRDCKNSIHTNKDLLANFNKEEMLAEKRHNQLEAIKDYGNRLKRYQKKIDRVTGELEGYLTGVFDRLASPSRLPTYEEAVSNTRSADSYQLGQYVSNFIKGKDFSKYAQNHLVESLHPYLDEREMGNVRRMLNKLPSYPEMLLPIKGPLEKKYSKLKSKCNSDQCKMGELETRVRDLIARYSCFEIGPDGKVKAPSVADFSKYLPD